MFKKLLAGTLTATILVASLTGCGGGSQSASSSSEAAAASDTGAVSASSEEKEASAVSETVTIGYLPITHALAAAEEKKLLDANQEGLTIELQKFSSWSDLTDALNSGSIDGASVLIELAMSAVSQGIDLKAVALGHKDGNVIVAADDIETVEDLQGKTVAIPHTQSSHNILVQDALAKAGLTTDDITVVQLAPTEMPSSLASGSIDAYCVAEPFGAQAVSMDFGHVLESSEDLWENSLCCGLVLNQSSIDRLGAETVQLLIDRYYEAGALLDAEESLAVATEYLGQDEEVLKTSLEWIKYDDLQITEEDYNDLVERVTTYGINDNPPAYEDFVYQADSSQS